MIKLRSSFGGSASNLVGSDSSNSATVSGIVVVPISPPRSPMRMTLHDRNYSKASSFSGYSPSAMEPSTKYGKGIVRSQSSQQIAPRFFSPRKQSFLYRVFCSNPSRIGIAVFMLFLLMDLSKSHINGGSGASSGSSSGASVTTTTDIGHIRASAANANANNNNAPEVDAIHVPVTSEIEIESQQDNETGQTTAFPEKNNTDNKGKKEKETKKEELEDGLMKAFKKFDANGDGTISKEEVKSILEQFGQSMTEEQLDAVVRGADSDGDGTIKFDEFKRAWGDEEE